MIGMIQACDRYCSSLSYNESTAVMAAHTLNVDTIVSPAREASPGHALFGTTGIRATRVAK